MAKMTNEQKLEALKGWLKENNIGFIENYKSNFGVTMDLKIPSLMIAVFLSKTEKRSEWEESIYHAKLKKGRTELHWKYRPFFIRESETKAFVLEKIQNCCFECMVKMQRKFEKEQKKKNENEKCEIGDKRAFLPPMTK